MGSKVFYLTSVGGIRRRFSDVEPSETCKRFTLKQAKENGIVECLDTYGEVIARLVFRDGAWKLFTIERVDAQVFEEWEGSAKSLEELVEWEVSLYY